MQLAFIPRISHQVSLEPMSVFNVMGDDMNCKTDQIRAAWHAGDRIGALRIAARFFDRSIDTKAFLSATWQGPSTADASCVGIVG
jgi:hypothetical protein